MMFDDRKEEGEGGGPKCENILGCLGAPEPAKAAFLHSLPETASCRQTWHKAAHKLPPRRDLVVRQSRPAWHHHILCSLQKPAMRATTTPCCPGRPSQLS